MINIGRDACVVLSDRFVVILCSKSSISTFEGIANHLICVFDLLVAFGDLGILFLERLPLGFVCGALAATA